MLLNTVSSVCDLSEKFRENEEPLTQRIKDNSSSVVNIAMGNQGIGDASHLFSIPSAVQTNLNNRTISVIVGKLLGGSSAVNGLQFHRGQKEDYDRWGSYFGESSDWSWEGLLPYFKKV